MQVALSRMNWASRSTHPFGRPSTYARAAWHLSSPAPRPGEPPPPDVIWSRITASPTPMAEHTAPATPNWKTVPTPTPIPHYLAGQWPSTYQYSQTVSAHNPRTSRPTPRVRQGAEVPRFTPHRCAPNRPTTRLPAPNAGRAYALVSSQISRIAQTAKVGATAFSGTRMDPWLSGQPGYARRRPAGAHCPALAPATPIGAAGRHRAGQRSVRRRS